MLTLQSRRFQRHSRKDQSTGCWRAMSLCYLVFWALPLAALSVTTLPNLKSWDDFSPSWLHQKYHFFKALHTDQILCYWTWWKTAILTFKACKLERKIWALYLFYLQRQTGRFASYQLDFETACSTDEVGQGCLTSWQGHAWAAHSGVRLGTEDTDSATSGDAATDTSQAVENFLRKNFKKNLVLFRRETLTDALGEDACLRIATRTVSNWIYSISHVSKLFC